MFNFLFRRKAGSEPEVIPETQRETLTRALEEVNAVIALMDPKPAVTFDPMSGALSLALPDQMPDEALALPAPEDSAGDAQPPETASETPAAEAGANSSDAAANR